MNHDEFRKTVKEFEMLGDPPGARCELLLTGANPCIRGIP
jgi:hypothetical protein